MSSLGGLNRDCTGCRPFPFPSDSISGHPHATAKLTSIVCFLNSRTLSIHSFPSLNHLVPNHTKPRPLARRRQLPRLYIKAFISNNLTSAQRLPFAKASLSPSSSNPSTSGYEVSATAAFPAFCCATAPRPSRVASCAITSSVTGKYALF